jgi:DNA-binding MarR family transcriptional regulator
MSSRVSPRKSSRTIGSLLRIAYASLAEEYARWLASSPYKNIQPAHAAALQPLSERPDGLRLTALAQTARITKQSMGALVDSLEAWGYVERVKDPDDGRASRVRLTARGRRFARDARAFSREVEARIAEHMGQRKLEELRAGLELLAGSDGDAISPA